MRSRMLDELTEETLDILSRAGFIVREINYPEEGRSVDIVGGSGGRKIILKVVYNSARISRREIDDLKKLSATYKASVLIVSEKYWRNEMEDDVVYVRNDIYVVNKNLLRNYFLRNNRPLIINLRGTYLLRIDNKSFARKRIELGLSRSEVANKLNVSKETIYQYETKRSMTSIQTAIKIANLMGEDVFEEVDLMDESLFNQPEVPVENKVLYNLAEAVKIKHLRVFEFSTTPVDGALVKDDKSVSIVQLAGYSREEMELKTENAVKMSSITKSAPIFIDDEKKIEKIKHAVKEIFGE
ncbi:MAG: helix-turn-helix domain-containing protein [Thermogladius sp.]|jgi:putative transcriptional regulator|nr:helix-turn-helix domain-containing protein [Thermogladius sp.]